MEFSHIMALGHLSQRRNRQTRPSAQDLDVFYDLHSGAELRAIRHAYTAAYAITLRVLGYTGRKERFAPSLNDA